MRANYGIPLTSLLFSLLILSCGPTESRETTDEFGYRTVAEVDKETGLRQGIQEIYDADGKLMERANYTNDRLDGTRTLYAEDGKPNAVETYRDGEYNGPFIAYGEDGKVQLVGGYVDGKMQRTWTGYYPDGKVREVVTFMNNEENGAFREWYPDGKPKATGNYLEGDNEHGVLHIYAEDGGLERVMNCDRGVCATFWTPDSTGQTPPPAPDMTAPPAYQQ